MEYWMYALLQLADDETAGHVLAELRSHPTGSPMSLKSAHPFAGVPVRYLLERRQWRAAASLESVPADLPWDNFPVAHALTVFARAMGSARTMELADARGHIAELESLRDRTNNAYWSRQIEVLRREAAAWLVQAKGDSDAALRLLESAVTPGPVLPAREQLGELLVAMGRPAEGLSAFEAALAAAPNRFNGLYGAGIAARDMGDTAKARDYFATLVAMCDEATGSRPELDVARRFLED